MKLPGLKIVTKESTIQRSVAATIEDTPPPLIHSVEHTPPRIVRRLDVDDVLARSVPKTAVEILPRNAEPTLSRT